MSPFGWSGNPTSPCSGLSARDVFIIQRCVGQKAAESSVGRLRLIRVVLCIETIFSQGLPSVGKLTIARELAKLTGFEVFHNHLTVGLI